MEITEKYDAGPLIQSLVSATEKTASKGWGLQVQGLGCSGAGFRDRAGQKQSNSYLDPPPALY